MSDVKPKEDLAMGRGGWARFQSEELPTPVFMRFAEKDGILEARELYLAFDHGEISADLIRRLPVGRIKAWINTSPWSSVFLSDLRSQAGGGPDLRRAITFWDRNVEPAEDSWPASMISYQATHPPPVRPLADPIADLPAASGMGRPDLHLEIPSGRPFPDTFYASVAELYRLLAGRVRDPVGQIADANEIEVSRVYRWVKVARDKHYLETGQRGKVGG